MAYDERSQIRTLVKTGHALRAIARELDRPVSTICREVQRNSSIGTCEQEQAQANTE